MEPRLEHFVNDEFAPYGDFPSRAEITRELLANLIERYRDFQQEGMGDEEAYQATLASFGDVGEIMEQVAPDARDSARAKDEGSSFRKTLSYALKRAKATFGLSRFGAMELRDADLSDRDLPEEDFSYSMLVDATFDRSNLTGATFVAATLRGSSFAKANLTGGQFAVSDLHKVDFTGANLTGARFRMSSLEGASFDGATLLDTGFQYCDLSGLSFRDTRLRNVSLQGAGVARADFTNATMDKITYEQLRSGGAKLDRVTVE